MEEYEVDAPVGEIVHWIRADAVRARPTLSVRASKSYAVETDFDRAAFGIGEDEDLALISVHGVIEVQSQRGLKDWTLQLRIDETVGLHPRAEERIYDDEDDMSLAAFDEQFLSEGLGEIEVVLVAETPAAKTRFDRWLKRHFATRAA